MNEKEFFIDKTIKIKDEDNEKIIWNGIQDLTTKKQVGLINGSIIHFFNNIDEKDELLKYLQELRQENIKYLEDLKYDIEEIKLEELIQQRKKRLKEQSKTILKLLLLIDEDYKNINIQEERIKLLNLLSMKYEEITDFYNINKF
jgi:hypothetical protein